MASECVICSEKLSATDDVSQVTPKGLQTVISSSLARNDGLVVKFENVALPVTAHKLSKSILDRPVLSHTTVNVDVPYALNLILYITCIYHDFVCITPPPPPRGRGLMSKRIIGVMPTHVPVLPLSTFVVVVYALCTNIVISSRLIIYFWAKSRPF